MKKTFATLSCALLAAIGLYAQNTALQFDGVDDFAFVTVNNPPATISAESFTFEAIFRAMPNGKNMVLFSAPQPGGDLLFGIGQNGSPYTSYRGNHYEGEGPYLSDGECHHMAITYTNRDVRFYVDGQYQINVTLNAPISFTNQTNFYLGMNYPDQNTAFQGVLDEVRLWPQARTDADIAAFANSTPTGNQLQRYLLLPFWEGAGTTSFDPLASLFNYAYWLTSEGADMQWTGSCLEENYNFSERIGSGPEPPCFLSSNPANLLCNGDFEQFDPILFTPPSWATPEAPLTPDVNGVSDVIKWRRFEQPSLYLSDPSFLVRNGIGGIPFNGMNTYNTLTNNDAFAYMASFTTNGTQLYQEGIEQDLNTILLQGGHYKFSGWAYTGAGTQALSHNLRISISSTAVGGTHVNFPDFILTNHNFVSGNNGWEYFVIYFTVPNTPSVAYDRFHIRVVSPINQAAVYSGFDDLVLEQVPFIDNCPTCFQAHIGSGTLNDSFHRRMVVDASNNIYVTGKVSNDSPTGLNFGFATGGPNLHSLASNTVSSYIAKYSSTGTLLWSKRYPEAEINDIEILPNGNLFITGTTTSASASAVNINWQQTVNIPITLPWGPTVNITHQSGLQLLFGQVNSTTGVAILETRGGSGYEIGVDATVIGNKVYIACEIGPYHFVWDNPNWPVSTPKDHRITTNSGLIGFSTTKLQSAILIYDWALNSRDAFNNYTPNQLQMLAANGTNLFVLTQNELHKLNTTSPNLPGSGIALNINNGQGQFARDMVVSPTNQVYITFSQLGMKQYDGATMQLQQASNDGYYALASNGTDVYALAVNANSILVSKLDVSANAPLGQAEWSRTILATDAFFPHFHSAGDLTVADIVTVGTSGKVAYVANFENTATPWQINFGTKSLAASVNLAHGHTFVASMEDLGNSGQFKTNPVDAGVDAANSQVLIMPNPAHGQVMIQSTAAITAYRIYNVMGSIVQQGQAEATNALQLDIAPLTKGLYVVEVNTENGIYLEKLVVD